MKTLRYRLFAIVFLVVFLLGTSLPQGRAVSANGLNTDPPYQVFLPLVERELVPIIPDTTEVLDNTTTDSLSSVSTDGAVYTFDQSTADLSSLAPGDVMIGEPSDAAPDGFMRTVDSISVVDGKTVVQTGSATLEEAIQQGGTQVSQVLTTADIRSVQNAKGVTISPQSFASRSGAFYIKIEDVILYDKDKDPKTTNDQITADGSIEVTPTLNFDLSIQNWQLQRFVATVSLHDKVEIGVKAKASLGKVEPEPYTLFTMNLNPITAWVGWVPIVFTPTLIFQVGIKGELYVSVSTKLTQEATLTGGVKYENSQWTPVSEFNNEFGWEIPTVSGNAEVKAFAGPVIKIMLYGVAGPQFSLFGYLKLEVQLAVSETPFNGKLYGGISLSMKVKMEILGRTLQEYELEDLLGWKALLLQWPPASPASPSPADASIEQALNASLSWAASIPAEADLIQGLQTYDVYFEAADDTPDVLASSNQSGTTYNPGALSPGILYYWQITAHGLFGMTTSGPVWSFTTRVNHAPNAPSAPFPALAAISQPLSPTLSWTGGDPDGDSLTYDVYFGTNGTALGAPVSTNQTALTYHPSPLNPNTQYFWKIVAKDAFGVVTAGPVWNFTTRINHAPNAPANPSPALGAINRPPSAVLSWTGSDPDAENDLKYDVYLGTDSSALDTPVSTNQTAATYDPPGLLTTNTLYYWKSVARDRFDAETVSPLWSFTTAAAAWTGSGPGTIQVVSDGTAADPLFTYDLNPAGFDPVAWDFMTIADHTGPVTLGYHYTGSHAWSLVTVFLKATVNGEVVNTLVNDGPVDCCVHPSDGFDYSGSFTFNVNVGDTYGFQFGGSNYDLNNFLQGSLAITLPPGQWNTFLGAAGVDSVTDIAVESVSGDIYVTGYSEATWGDPIHPFAGGTDAFVAKLDHYGHLLWNTFLGSEREDHGNGIALMDGSSSIIIAGDSRATWGDPLTGYAGGQDGFVAMLDSSGALQWNTFMGSVADDSAIKIVPDSVETFIVAGNSAGPWGTSTHYAGGTDIFYARYHASGSLNVMTFLGSAGEDELSGLVYANDVAYVTGTSDQDWGTPVNPYAGGTDAFVAKIIDINYLSANTFLGSTGDDHGSGIGLDASGNVIVVGDSTATWGSPVTAYAGGVDVFAAALDSDLALLHNTFLGSAQADHASGVIVDAAGDVIIAGDSLASWGAPVDPYMGGKDAFIAHLNGDDLAFLQNNFLGSAGDDWITSIAVDSFVGNEIVAGSSSASWRSPIRPYTGGMDGFVALRR